MLVRTKKKSKKILKSIVQDYNNIYYDHWLAMMILQMIQHVILGYACRTLSIPLEYYAQCQRGIDSYC
jgi:hypothetical protein